MERRPFGSTKREVAVSGQGPGTSIGAIAGPRWPRCAWASIWRLPTSTPQLYGDAEEVVAEAIAGRREEVEQGTVEAVPRAAGRCGRRTISSVSSWRASGSRRAAWRSCATPRRGA